MREIIVAGLVGDLQSNDTDKNNTKCHGCVKNELDNGRQTIVNANTFHCESNDGYSRGLSFVACRHLPQNKNPLPDNKGSNII
jgi:hypothetical protein